MSTPAQGAKAFELSDRAIDSRTQVVTIRGEVDLYDAPDIRRRIDELIDAGKTLQAIDLTEARFVDSTTVGVLLAGGEGHRERIAERPREQEEKGPDGGRAGKGPAAWAGPYVPGQRALLAPPPWPAARQWPRSWHRWPFPCA
jgi:hypothetical protein